MKRIDLQRLTLENFQGGNFVLEPDGESARIFAQNGKGKTRLFTAYTYLTTGRDSLGRSTFEIKNINADGSYDTEATVEEVLIVDGQPLSLKKTYREKRSTVRGKAEKKFTGNETLHFVDDVPKAETEYKALVAEMIGDEEVLSLITNPSAFALMPDKKGVPGWQRQRGILLDVVGDVSDAQVIETNSDLEPLVDLLKRFTVSKTPVEDFKKVTKASRSIAEGERDKIPVQIEENRRIMPDIAGLDREQLATEVADLETKLADAKLRLTGVDNGGAIAELSKKLATLNADITKIEGEHRSAAMSKYYKLDDQVQDIKSKADQAERRAKGIREEIEAKQKGIKLLEIGLNKIDEAGRVKKAEEFQDTTEDTCPACGQSLPADRVEKAREKARADFNRKKAEALTSLRKEWDDSLALQDKYRADVEKLQNTIVPVPGQDGLDELVSQRDAIKAASEDYDSIPARIPLIGQRAELEGQIKAAREGVAGDRKAIDGEIQSFEIDLKAAKEKAQRFVDREKGEARIKELKAQEKTYAKQIEEAERHLYLCKLFTKTKVNMLNDRIQAKFKFVQFRLFRENITNDGIEDSCEITVNGVPYNAGLNSGARIMAGLEICDVLQEHYGIRAPVFVDDAEKFTSPIGMNCQVIELVAKADEPVLRVETAHEAPRKAAGGRLL